MRPTRLLLTLVFFFLTVFLTFYSLLISHPPEDAATSSKDKKHGLSTLFSWHMPSTLFPQSAIISLTDDNSTFFLSRPANYGPRLPTDGLSGQLWVASGFTEDVILKGGVATKLEGELGCGDIPGWDPSQMLSSNSRPGETKAKHEGSAEDSALGQQEAAPQDAKSPGSAKTLGSRPDEDDGSDDFLHWPLKNTMLSKQGQLDKGLRDGRDEHADIQSLQESAEIAGKVVLLSRGGCGFLEKTKWVQRRGGMALIVGDNVRGGPLTTMYANGDASNITIPSLFTTRTTAHLLSSLIPPKSGEGPESPPKGEDTAKIKSSTDKAATVGSRSASRPETKHALTGRKRSRAVSTKARRHQKGWIPSILSGLSLKRSEHSDTLASDSSRPPSSGTLNWVISEDWDDDVSAQTPKGKGDSKADKKQKNGEKNPAPPKDNFVIGVQDWRDPDMMKPEQPKQPKPEGSSQVGKSNSKVTDNKELAGGSYTPGSGVYHSSEDPPSTGSKIDQTSSEVVDPDSEGWFGRLFGGSDHGSPSSDSEDTESAYGKTIASSYVKEKEFEDFAEDHPSDREGLWVTMTPTTISTTPFFDTLLVLVVSPLVTLTVVYALLIVRSRIRRRRWRAPKSVVDRLPVRTYHTMSCSSTSTSSQATSPEGSSPTSPLLRNNSRAILSRSRPRSRTTSVLADEVSTSLDKANAKAALSKGERKRIQPKRYNGRQVECVVCLEEYIDGQSQVMSLPCGHEFHAECITPWLTTRRRTCPICKGDVVRSMAAASSNSSSSSDLASAGQLHGIPNVEDVQTEAAHTRNESPSAAIPIPHGDDADLERGDDLAATLVNDESSSSSNWNWRELASRSMSAVRGESWRRTQEDRSR